MSQSLALDQVLADGKRKEEKYDWLGAAELYRKTLASISEKSAAEVGELCERSGYASFQSGMQATNLDDFQKRMRQSLEDYERFGHNNPARAQSGPIATYLRCQAMVAYVRYWLAENASDKKRFIQDAWRLAKETFEKFEEEGDESEYDRTYIQLSLAGLLSSLYEKEFPSIEKLVMESLEFGERAIRRLSTDRFPRDSARIYAILSGLLDWAANSLLPEPNDQSKTRQKALGYWTKARNLSEEAALLELPRAAISVGLSFLGIGSNEAQSTIEKTLAQTRKTRNRLLQGLALDTLALHTAWKALAAEDAEQQRNTFGEAVVHAERARKEYAPIGFKSPTTNVVWAGAPYSEYYLLLNRLETDRARKHELLAKSMGPAKEDLKNAEDSGYPENISVTHHLFSKILAAMGEVETEAERKRILFEEAMKHRIEANRINEQTAPNGYWNLGVMKNYLANIESKLADLTKESDNKTSLLQEAILQKEASLAQCRKWIERIEETESLGQLAWFADRQLELGNLRTTLFSLRGDQEDLRKAAGAFDQAAMIFEKAHMSTRTAEAYWKAAQTYDILNDHAKAADSFTHASNEYNLSSEKIAHLKGFYQEYASYMDVWSLIENARIDHNEERFLQAAEHYSKAASKLRSTKSWNYLTKHYEACSFLEGGEALSRQERSKESKESFSSADDKFREATADIENTRLNPAASVDKEDRKTWLDITRNRGKYCNGRVQLEEAKALDKDGDKVASARRYDSAARTFRELLAADNRENDRRELETISTFCQAWAKMKEAEIEESPESFAEAAELFGRTKEFTTKKKTRVIAMANASICKALEVGSRFRLTRDAGLYAKIKKQLEIATDYYEQAGLQNSADWTRATANTFDALVLLAEAATARDPGKKVADYQLAERHLQQAAKLYADSGFPARREEASRRLKRAREERELLLAPMEVLAGNPAFSGETNVPVSLDRDRAVGLERFETANVVGNLSGPKEEIGVGADFTLELELANVGKTAATLLKLEGVVVDGIEIDKEKVAHRVEDNYLDMKGKRLDYLKTHELKIPLRAKRKGVFQLGPRILFVDEKGNYRSFEFEPTSVTVKELGISGWLKGPK